MYSVYSEVSSLLIFLIDKIETGFDHLSNATSVLDPLIVIHPQDDEDE